MTPQRDTADLRLDALSETDLENAVITLDQGPSFGSCPGYRLTLRGDGTVVYEADDFVRGKRVERKKIPQAKVRELIAEFFAAGYYSLRESYSEMEVTCQSWITTSIAIGNVRKSITRYSGDLSAPKALRDLENKIDEIADSAQWV